MQIRQMEYMLALAAKRNLSQAAEGCFISQSALSQSLAKLENDLGTKLFTRRKNAWLPTEAGDRYLETAKEITRLYDRLLLDLRRFDTGNAGTLRIGMSLERSTHLFPIVYARLQAEFPDTALQLGEGNFYALRQMVMCGEADFALTIMPEPDQEQEERCGLDSLQMMEEDIVLIVPPFHPLTQRDFSNPREVPRLEDLEGEKFIRHNRQKALRHMLDSVFKASGVNVSGDFEVASTHGAIEFVSRGLGISFVPRTFVLADSGVRIIPITPALSWKLGVLYRKGREISAKERRLAAIIKEEFLKLPWG